MGYSRFNPKQNITTNVTKKIDSNGGKKIHLEIMALNKNLFSYLIIEIDSILKAIGP